MTVRKLVLVVASMCALSAVAAAPRDPPASRGRYLIEMAGCGHCHTPGHFLGKEDLTRELAGGDVGFEVPGAGTFIGPNLTPDRETGLGGWTDQQVERAIRNGVRPDGRMLSPVMPWANFTIMSNADLAAIIAYLRTLRPVSRKVPGPFAPGTVPEVAAWRMYVPPPQSGPKPDMNLVK